MNECVCVCQVEVNISFLFVVFVYLFTLFEVKSHFFFTALFSIYLTNLNKYILEKKKKKLTIYINYHGLFRLLSLV